MRSTWKKFWRSAGIFLFIYLFVYFAKRQPFTSKAIHHRRLNEFAEQ